MATSTAGNIQIKTLHNREGIITKGTFATRVPVERALLVAVETKREIGNGWSTKDSVAELAQLASNAGARVVGEIVQHLRVPSPTHYIGKGKLEELQSKKNSLSYDLVIADDELSPRQQRNLEEALDARVIDRVVLILDVFARRAKTREGQLQVELAQHEYLLPRLTGRWGHLERLGGGIGTRGPGESQLETDRRLIRHRIHNLQKQIENVRKQRQLYRERRRKNLIPVVSLVGYTNAGKSTLLNALSDAHVAVEDRLFSTLDPTTRRLTLADNTTVLLTDTVGFIQKLPPAIVHAFRATLEELSEANVLLHVVDLSSSSAVAQCQTVEQILADLALGSKPRITALNKIDLLLDSRQEWDEKSALGFLSEQPKAGYEDSSVLISAERGWGLEELKELIRQVLDKQSSLQT